MRTLYSIGLGWAEGEDVVLVRVVTEEEKGSSDVKGPIQSVTDLL